MASAKTPPTELMNLIEKRKWPDVIHRCQTDPQEVGSARGFRNDRGYTALHALVAYNQTASGEELVPVIKAILRAADEINYGAEFRLGGNDGEVKDETKFNTNEIVEGEDSPGKEARKMDGSWRLLLDQENKACWSPLHLTCVHGGITLGKMAVIKALLKMDENENSEEEWQYQQKILTLPDRQNRNLLHHLLTSLVPSQHSFSDVHRLCMVAPALLFQNDTEGKKPLAYVLERLLEKPGTRRRHFMVTHGRDDEGEEKNYRMLRLLVKVIERETRGWGHIVNMGEQLRLDIIAPTGKLGVVLFTRQPPAPPGPPYVSNILDDSPLKEKLCLGDKVIAVDSEDVGEMTSIQVSTLLARKNEQAERRITILREVDGDEQEIATAAASGEDSVIDTRSTKNVLQCACLIPRDFCPSDGSLIAYLSSEKVAKLEAKVRGDATAINMVSETDGKGDTALHSFMANKSYAIDDSFKSSDEAAPASQRKGRSTEDKMTPQINAEYKAMKAILDVDRSIASLPNDKRHTPLHIAMKSGRRRAVALLVMEHPETVLLDDRMESTQLFMHVLGCISTPRICRRGNGGSREGSNANDEEQAKMLLRCLTTMFDLMRGRPDIVSFAGSSEPKLGSNDDKGGASKKKKWWKNFKPFR